MISMIDTKASRSVVSSIRSVVKPLIVRLRAGRQGLRAGGRLRKRTLGVRFEMIDNFLCGYLTGADAIGDTDTVVGAARENESRNLTQRSLNSIYAHIMADVILRHGIRVAINAREKRLRRDAEQARQFRADVSLHRRIVVVNQFRLQRSPDESAQ